MYERSKRYIPLEPEVVQRAREMDLFSYLSIYDPGNLVKVAAGVYCTREHDSLKISNSKWFWWSRGFGGVSALDYLIKVKGMDFVSAVEHLTGEQRRENFREEKQIQRAEKPKVLLLPEKNENNEKVKIIKCRNMPLVAARMEATLRSMLPGAISGFLFG